MMVLAHQNLRRALRAFCYQSISKFSVKYTSLFISFYKYITGRGFWTNFEFETLILLLLHSHHRGAHILAWPRALRKVNPGLSIILIFFHEKPPWINTIPGIISFSNIIEMGKIFVPSNIHGNELIDMNKYIQVNE